MQVERTAQPKHEETVVLVGGEDFDDEEFGDDDEAVSGQTQEGVIPDASGKPAGARRGRRRRSRRPGTNGADATPQGGNNS